MADEKTERMKDAEIRQTGASIQNTMMHFIKRVQIIANAQTEKTRAMIEESEQRIMAEIKKKAKAKK